MTDLEAPAAPARSPMARLAAPSAPARSPMTRLAPVVFAHARVAMLTTTTSGLVVEANEVAAALFGRRRFELVQEPIGRHVVVRSGLPIEQCLRDAARSPTAESFGLCAVRRRGGPEIVTELVVSSGCRISGRDLLLLQFVPVHADPPAGWPSAA